MRVFLKSTAVRLVLALFLVMACLLRPQASHAASMDVTPYEEKSGLSHYSLSIFPDGSVLRNPNSGAISYIEVYPGTAIRGNVILDLWYSYSPIVIPEISTMTILVNGTPVDSKILKVDGAARSNWRLAIPESNFTEGMNDVEVSVVHRTIDGLCRDIDNDANWFIVRPETKLLFGLEGSARKLSDFPRPFTDYYTPEKMNTVVYLPHDYEDDTLSELMNLGTLLGRNSQAGLTPSRMTVRIGNPGQLDSNEIVFERTGAPQVVSDDEVLLKWYNMPNGHARLSIAASGDLGYAKGVEALARSNLLRTFDSYEMKLSAPLPDQTRLRRSIPGSQRELFTLVDLGFENDIRVAGAFHQEANIFVQRPPNYRAADGSYVDLYFRHSSVLDPKKSAVTVYVNDIPIKAQTLRAENADGGILRAPIPASELGRPYWSLRFAFYHDLGIVDCSKRYDDVAWSVVEKRTSIFLKRGNIPYIPSWSNFPNDFYADHKGRIDLTMLMLDEPDSRSLSAAFRLAYYIGMNNAADISWHAVHIDDFDQRAAKGAVLAIGGKRDEGWNKLQEHLPIYPDEGTYRIEPWLEIAPEVLDNFDIYQVAKLGEERWLYAFMYNSVGGFQNLVDFALRAPIPLAGQVALVDTNGSVTSYARDAEVTEKRIEWFEYLASHIGGTAAIYAVVLAAVVLVTIVIMLVTFRKGRAR